MDNATEAPYVRTVAVVVAVLAAVTFAATDLRVDTWEGLKGFFEWSETTPFGVIGKTWGAAFAVVEAFHLLAMALMGGAILVGDGRLLGLWFTDTPSKEILDKAHRLFVVGLGVLLFTGVFMACGVAMKIYYPPVFWYKMLALGTGILFVFCIRRPLLKEGCEPIAPWVAKLTALASLMIWFTVAATGRWIGFSG